MSSQQPRDGSQQQPRGHSSVKLTGEWLEAFTIEIQKTEDLSLPFFDDVVSSRPPPPPPPIDEIAFFPLPSFQDDNSDNDDDDNGEERNATTTDKVASPIIARRISATKVTISSTFPPQPPDIPPKTPDAGKKLIGSIKEEDYLLEEFEDLSLGSVETVASSEFSERNADEIWEDVPMGPPDSILGIAQAYKACADPRKVNVAVGAYRNSEGNPWVLPSVRQAERLLFDQNENKEYLPIDGDRDYVKAAMKFAYGEDVSMDHLATVQTVSFLGVSVFCCFLFLFWTLSNKHR